MLVRSFGPGGAFEVSDWTQEITTIQNQWGTISQMGLFREESVTQYTVAFEATQENGGVIIDRVRGDRHNVAKAQPKQIHTFSIPFFNLNDEILPQDIQGKRAYGTANEADQLAEVRVKKMNYIRRAHARTLEVARAQAIVQGTVYAPSGTVVQDWNLEFNVTRTVVNFPFSSASTQVMPNIEKIIAAIQDNAGMTDFNGIVGLCSPQFFAALISHPSIQVAYTYYASTQDLLRSRQAPGGSVTAKHREFTFGGITFMEMRDNFNGQRLIPDNEAYFVPTGTDAFATYFAPCSRFGFVNTPGEQLYLFEQPALDGTGISLISESNHVSALLRPELVIKATMN
jgi:hypothetical protein